MSTNEIIETIGKEQKHIAEIEAKLPEIVKVKMRSPKTGFQAPESHFGVYKSDGGRCLGVVGEATTPTQPKFLLNTVLNTVMQNGDVFDLSTIDYIERNEGSRIEFLVDMEPFQVPSKLEVGDITKIQLMFSTSYDGKQSNRVDLMTTRCWCDNQQVRRFKSSSISIKNTKNASKRIEEYFFDLTKILSEVEVWKEDMLRLVKRRVTNKEIEATICSAFQINPDVEERPKRQQARFDEVMERMDIEIEGAGKNAYGVFQGLTNYVNHVLGAEKGPDYMITRGGFLKTEDAERAIKELF